MDAAPLLAEIARRLQEASLEAVLIGNAAAALQGAPVTTVDFDFLFRSTPRNLAKLKQVADGLRATILRPYYPASNLYRVVRDAPSLACAIGRAQLRSTVSAFAWRRCPISSGASVRPDARATGPCWGFWRPPLKKAQSRRERLAAVARESRRNLIEQIRRWQALPPERRTNFLRKRVNVRGSAL